MKKLLLIAFLGLGALGGLPAASPACTFGLFPHSCCGCGGGCGVCIRPYNAFSPVLCGCVCCDGCFAGNCYPGLSAMPCGGPGCSCGNAPGPMGYGFPPGPMVPMGPMGPMGAMGPMMPGQPNAATAPKPAPPPAANSNTPKPLPGPTAQESPYLLPYGAIQPAGGYYPAYYMPMYPGYYPYPFVPQGGY